MARNDETHRQKREINLFTLIDPDWFAASVAILGKDGVEAVQAIGSRIAHYVALAAQDAIAFKTGKVAHVPGPAFRFCTLVRQNQLNCKLVIREE